MVAQRSVSMSSMAPNLVAKGSKMKLRKRSKAPETDTEKTLTLVESPGCVAIEGVQQPTQQVAEDSRPGAAGHQVEGEQGQGHPAVPCRNKAQ